MKTRLFTAGLLIVLLTAVGAFAQMGGPMPGPMPGPGPGPGMGNGKGNGMGYGMKGAGGMVSGMMGNTVDFEYLDVLDPITTPAEAITAIKAFITASNSSLQISELWEYGTVYKAELMDTNSAMAFDIIADKFTGAVSPEMGMSMMLNASYGKGMYKTTTFAKNLTVTAAQATQKANDFLKNNSATLPYDLKDPEIYPGYYKIHTTDKQGNPGLDIMVNGYNGEIWMNTYLGLPLGPPMTSGF